MSHLSRRYTIGLNCLVVLCFTYCQQPKRSEEIGAMRTPRNVTSDRDSMYRLTASPNPRRKTGEKNYGAKAS